MLIKSTHPESQGDFVVIENDDFDPEKHEVYVEGEEKTEGPTREAMKSFLTTCGVTFPANIKGDKLAELYAAEKAKFEAA